MPIHFHDLARGTRDAVLDLGDGDVIAFSFRHGLITPRLIHDLMALDESRIKAMSVEDADRALMAVSDHVARILASWDVLDEDGGMFPLERERLASDIPFMVQIRLLQTCLTEMQPGEAAAPGANGHASGAGSSPTARSARRRTGTR